MKTTLSKTYERGIAGRLLFAPRGASTAAHTLIFVTSFTVLRCYEYSALSKTFQIWRFTKTFVCTIVNNQDGRESKEVQIWGVFNCCSPTSTQIMQLRNEYMHTVWGMYNNVEFWAFLDPSGQNQLYHTPLLSKIWDLNDRKKIGEQSL